MSNVKMPEPVTAIYYCGDMVDVYTHQQMQAYAQAVRDEALDKAADLVGGSSMTSRPHTRRCRALSA